jgi:hypothetical protein
MPLPHLFVKMTDNYNYLNYIGKNPDIKYYN